MTRLVNFVTKLHKSTKRSYLGRMMNNKKKKMGEKSESLSEGLKTEAEQF